ncbi:tetratricopeptide repeat protein [Aquabacterium sp.]|uniref:tetratricopeptide repeat protein n=1 Tax=Aquabacterium sp. TaxID=1872578 RepID=UPI003D6CEAD6
MRLSGRACCLLITLVTGMAQAAPFTPASDREVIETLRDRPLSDEEKNWRVLRAQARRHPQDADVATRMARQAIEISRRDGDPRWMGQAQGALQAWWTQPAPPTGVRLLRATILQNQHDFAPALRDLDAVVRQDPANAQAWLTRASVLQVLGRYDEARTACEALPRIGAPWHGQACLLELSSLQGQGERAMAALQALRRQAPPALHPWLSLIQAELSERLDRPAEADSLYQQLLLTAPDAYTEGAYADFLLDQGRPAEVIERLGKQQRNDGLLLRLALAYAQTKDARLDATVQALRARFNAAHERGDAVHRREEARFTLWLLHRPEAAMKLAKANWAVQKEPADARILLEAARAAQQEGMAGPVRDFMSRSGWSDHRLDTLK